MAEEEGQVSVDDWAAAMSEQGEASAPSAEDDWAAAMAEQGVVDATASTTPPQAATGSFAERITAESVARMSLEARMDSTPYAPRMPSPSSKTTTSGRPCVISVSIVRVSAGPDFAVVVTMPRSVKSMLRLAPESSIARMSRRSDTPVALKACTARPR